MQHISNGQTINKRLGGSGVRLNDGPDIKLFILVVGAGAFFYLLLGPPGFNCCFFFFFFIVYPCSGVRRRRRHCRCRCRQQCLNIFSSETAWPIKAKLYVEPPWEGGTKVCINGPGHMTKMASMPIYGKNF